MRIVCPVSEVQRAARHGQQFPGPAAKRGREGLKLRDTWEPRIVHNETPKYAWPRRTDSSGADSSEATRKKSQRFLGAWQGPGRSEATVRDLRLNRSHLL